MASFVHPMKIIVKILVSSAALILILRLVDMAALKQSILNIPLPILGLTVVIFTFGQLLSSYKWWLLASCGGIAVPWSLALRAYFFGMFINCFGVGTVGGDVARALVLAGASKQKTAALASVIADRVHGLTVLACIGLVSITAFGRHTIATEYLALMLICVSAIMLGWYFGPGIAMYMVPKEGLLHQKLQAMAGVFPRNIVTIAYISIISLVFHLLQISLHQVMALGFGIHIPWRALLVTIPVVNIVSSLPISWNGLGVRENGYVFFLAPGFLSREQAVAFGAMWLIAMTLSSAIGGVTALLYPDVRLRVRERIVDTGESRVIEK
jgi:uncharacterized membrane protein YbhN (UPF0104 family)